jgi:putative peptidoglycan lipid II flippase
VVLRDALGGLELGRLLSSSLRIGVASAALAGVAYLTWTALDGALGRGLAAQIFEMAAALGAGLVVYVGVVAALRVPELEQIRRLVTRRG